MSRFIPVEPEKWAEMVKAMALVKEMDKTINASQAECRRLKAEVEQYSEIVQTAHVDLLSQNARLKAELDRLADENARLTMMKDACKRMIKRRDKWILEKRAEVERLRKAGDAMAENLLEGCNPEHYMNALNWNAARDGKPSV